MVPPDEHRRALTPPQFGMRALLVGIALLSVTFAIANAVGSYAMLGVILIALSIVAHVIATSIGSQLSDAGNRPYRDSPAGNAKRSPLKDTDFAPESQLRKRQSLGAPLYLFTLSGAVATAVLGGVAIVRYLPEQANWQTLLVGITGCAVLGAVWSFLCFGFLRVTIAAALHASRDPNRKSDGGDLG